MAVSKFDADQSRLGQVLGTYKPTAV